MNMQDRFAVFKIAGIADIEVVGKESTIILAKNLDYLLRRPDIELALFSFAICVLC